jgi:hypothetical protein
LKHSTEHHSPIKDQVFVSGISPPRSAERRTLLNI